MAQEHLRTEKQCPESEVADEPLQLNSTDKGGLRTTEESRMTKQATLSGSSVRYEWLCVGREGGLQVSEALGPHF